MIEDSFQKLKLQPNEKLYCEGEFKPYWRGKLHLFAFLFFPLTITSLFNVSETKSELFIGTLLFCLGNMFCFGISFLFHCLVWTPKYEVFKFNFIFLYD